MASLETRYHAAVLRGDKSESARLARLMARLDDQARAYGKTQRGEQSPRPGAGGDLANGY